MPKLTMKQIARANNAALAYDIAPRKLVEALREAMEVAERVFEIPQDVTEDLFYKVLRGLDA